MLVSVATACMEHWWNNNDCGRVEINDWHRKSKTCSSHCGGTVRSGGGVGGGLTSSQRAGREIDQRRSPQGSGPLQEEMWREWYGWVDVDIVNRQEKCVSRIWSFKGPNLLNNFLHQSLNHYPKPLHITEACCTCGQRSQRFEAKHDNPDKSRDSPYCLKLHTINYIHSLG